MRKRVGYDDALDVFGVHCIGGVWGALATGLFASTAVNPGGADEEDAGLDLTQHGESAYAGPATGSDESFAGGAAHAATADG